MYNKEFNKKNLIDLVESYTKSFYYVFLFICFFFGNIFMLIIMFFTIFKPNTYKHFLSIIEDLQDLNNGNENKVNDYDDEDDEYESYEEEEEYEDDEKESFLYKYFKYGFLNIYFGYGLFIYSILYSLSDNQLLNYIYFSAFLLYCILYKYLFKTLFGFNINPSK